METPLNTRQKQVLTALVDHYIVLAEPVSSKVLSQTAVLKASSATIRNTMAELEDKGYVHQPHSSSGRLPTDLGYRTYVDELMHPEPLRPEDGQALENMFAAGESDEAALAKTARTLAEMSQLLGMAISPPSSHATFRQLSLMPVAEGKALLVLTSSDPEVRSLMVEPDYETSIFRLEALAARINRQMQGKPVSLLNKCLENIDETSSSQDEVQAADILNRSILKLVNKKIGEEIFLYGAKNLLNRPDLSNLKEIESILELLDSKITLVHFLRQRSDVEGVHVSVGEEHEDGRLFRSLSLVTAAFAWGEARGIVGVLGPKRIPYARLVPLMRQAAEVLGRKHKEGQETEKT